MARIHRMPGILPQARSIAPVRKRSRLPILILLVILLMMGQWFFFSSSVFAISSVEIVGSDDPSVKSIGDRLLGQNIFRLRTTSLEQDIRQAYPPVAEVVLVRGLPRRVRIEVTKRTPLLRWKTSEGVYILDSTGQSFAISDSDLFVQLPVVLDSSGLDIEVGQEVVAPTFIDFLAEVQSLIPQLVEKTVVGYEVRGTTYHLDILLTGEVRVKLTSQRPAKEQLESVQAILAAHPESRLVDVRVPGLGYYK